MAFNISPQINIFERDFTLTLEMKGDTKGAQSGTSSWGPVLHPTLIASGEEGLRGKFGAPNDKNYLSYFIARDFLKYSNKLVFNRVCGPLARNSSASTIGIQCPQERIYNLINWSPLFSGNCAFEISINNGPWTLITYNFGESGNYFSNMLNQITYEIDSDLFTGGSGGMAAWQVLGSNNAQLLASSGGENSEMFQSNPISIKMRDGVLSNVPVIHTAFGVSTMEIESCGFENFPGY